MVKLVPPVSDTQLSLPRKWAARVPHKFINPQGRAVHVEAQAVHGISAADLVGKPTFAEVAEEWLSFTDGAKLVAHNANFDIGFLNTEFGRLGQAVIDTGRVVDTLALARRKHPMGPNSLDALCRRYGIDNGHRTKHGALLDSELLAEVYIELIGGEKALIRTLSPGIHVLENRPLEEPSPKASHARALVHDPVDALHPDPEFVLGQPVAIEDVGAEDDAWMHGLHGATPK